MAINPIYQKRYYYVHIKVKQHENFNELLAFLIIARERSFTLTDVQLNISRLALVIPLKHWKRGYILLAQHAVFLLQKLESGLYSFFLAVKNQTDALSELRDKPAGTICIKKMQQILI